MNPELKRMLKQMAKVINDAERELGPLSKYGRIDLLLHNFPEVIKDYERAEFAIMVLEDAVLIRDSTKVQ